MELYRNRKIFIYEKDELFDYCTNITSKANNLSNAIRFRQRQVLTAADKDESKWTANEKEIIDEIKNALPLMGSGFKFNDKQKSLSYKLLAKLMCITVNPDYYAEGFPAQTAQHVIKQCVQDMKSFFAANNAYNANPSSFTGRPKLPGYKRKGGMTTCVFTNQDAVLSEENGEWFLKLPKTKIRLDCGAVLKEHILKEVEVRPDNGRFAITLTFNRIADVPEIKETPSRAASVDLGVDNLMSVTNNCHLPFLLYKGNILKSVNQYYNKSLAEIMSKQALSSGGKKFTPTEESRKIVIKRNDVINDFLHKDAKHLIAWCVENRIDTVVVGVNKTWKTEVHIGHVNNQNFVQIPFSKLRFILKYLCEENGIRYIEREESYTSKANFLKRDFIPTYGKDDKDASFTGKRRPTKYKSDYVKKNGFRGLYKTNDGKIINSDLNGSANILRKEFPELAEAIAEDDFKSVIIINHPDEGKTNLNRKEQLSVHRKPSKSKIRRLKRKGLLNESNPNGIGLCE